MMNDDLELAREYANHHSEPAFEKLVLRHIGLVDSAALRQVRDPSLAEEITQTVFMILARKAGSLGPKTVLAGWLYRTTRYVSSAALKMQYRRERREQAAQMQSMTQQTQADPVWEELAPLLDEAMAQLREHDRDAIVLRYFQNKSLQDVGAALGVNEYAAQKRVGRAVEKLRAIFYKHGITSTAGAIGEVISVNSIQTVPAALAKSVVTMAIAKGPLASASTLTLIQGALKAMAWTKAKTAVVVGVVVLIAAGTATVSIKKVKAHEVKPASAETWRIAGLTWQQVGQTAPEVKVLPTKFRPPVKIMQTCDGLRWGGIDVSVREMMRAAYRGAPGRVAFPDGEPQEKYDFISTLTDGTEEALQSEITKTLGLTARWETVETNALVLKVANPDAPGLKQASLSPDEYGDLRHGHIHCFGEKLSWTPRMPPWGLTKYLEIVFQVPVVDQTEFNWFCFNIDLRWKVKSDPSANQEALKQAMLEQLGLELVPTNMPVEILVVEKGN